VPGAGAKTLAYLPYTFSSICARAAGSADAVLANHFGRIADGAAASVFLIEKGRLLTPPITEGALPGITRGVVLELAKQLGIQTRAVPLPVRRLHVSEGVFLASALRGLRAVKQVDDHEVPMSIEARRLFGRLREAYLRAVARDLAAFR
jgi:branched-chain amino acid aminotransferase